MSRRGQDGLPDEYVPRPPASGSTRQETEIIELRRADAPALDPRARAAVLAHFGLSHKDWLAKGTEAEVYRLSGSRVLKLYADAGRAPRLKLLKSFYDSLDARTVGFALPQIYEVAQLEGLLAVQERRIEGSPLADVLPTLGPAAALQAREVYLEAVMKLAEVRSCYGQSLPVPREADTRETTVRDWNEIVYALAKVKLDRRRAALALDVVNLPEKEGQLFEACLAHRFEGPRSVIHGDFFPGNLLVDAALTVKGVIDFGSFALFGDSLYDVALACMLYDMYGPNRASIRDELVQLALERLGAKVEGTLYRYAMAYALMSCDLYASRGALRRDDHYLWAVDLLNTDRYWRRLR